MSKFHILEMISGKRIGFSKEPGDIVEALETVHLLNREYQQCRFTLVRPTEKHSGL